MARPLRIQYDGAWYHVMNRGINHMNIFLNNEHRKIFLYVLSEVVELFRIKVHSYCLMDNHYHLLIETPHGNLSNAMRHLNCVYTQWFNRLTKRDGALFRGRYKSILVETENYLLSVSRYIHLNPLAAGLVHEFRSILWSSYSYYINLFAPAWLTTSFLRKYFNKPKDYADFMDEGVEEELLHFYNTPKSSPILGDKTFVGKKIQSLSVKYKAETSPDVNRALKTFHIKEICSVVSTHFNVEITLLKKSFRNNSPRMLAIYLARNFTRLSHEKISDYFGGINKSSISTTVKRCKELIDRDEKAKRDYMCLIKNLSDVS